jgi:hypothetical protein
MSIADSRPSTAAPTDETGAVVNVVERDIQDADENGVDKVITPSSTRVKEQDAEAINRKAAEVERKLK